MDAAMFARFADDGPPLDDREILSIQHRLRRQFFEGPRAIRWRPGRDLAAGLLLYLDDPLQCWRLTTEWLREMLDADRVDGGFGGFVGSGGCAHDYVVLAEAQREAAMLPSVLGLSFSAANPGLRVVWSDTEVATVCDVEQERSFTEDLRLALRSVGTASKLALPIRRGAHPVGLVCADWRHDTPKWNANVCNELGGLALAVLGPVLATASQLAEDRHGGRNPHETAARWGVAALREAPPGRGGNLLGDLTPVELKVARLASVGLSYKEIARQLERSLSTVDHQLRSIRDKLGVRSTSRLVHLLSEHFERSGS